MASNTGQIKIFPSQAASDKEKKSLKYGLEVGRAIESEWFRRDSGSGRFQQQQVDFHRLRKYARGEQDTQIYKDRLSIDGDLSYVNLDFQPVHIIPKFVDIVVNGMQDRLFHIKAIAQDPIATGQRTDFVEKVESDIYSQSIHDEIEQRTGKSPKNFPDAGDDFPTDSEELEFYMQIHYKQGIEIAQEQAIDNVMMSNKYPELKKRIDYDLTVLGMGCAKHSFNGTDGIKLDYVDPADLVYSYTEDPNFEDVYYFGEIKRLRIGELKKMFPEVTNEEFIDIAKKGAKDYDYTPTTYEYQEDSYDSNTLQVLFFNWKTWESNNHKIKETSSGGIKAIRKEASFNPPKDARTRYEKIGTTREVVYEGCMVIGSELMLKWSKADNMVRPESNANKVMMNYVVSAPRLYKGKIESLVRRITTFADTIQLTHLKLQQAIQRMVPSGVYLDADGLVEIDLGNGTSYTPKEALNMYFQTGSIIGRSLTSEGDPNPGKIPIQELPGGGGGQVELLINAYNYYLNMIRDVTGLNEARDGSDPDPYSLVGVQKLAAANSNTATRHLLHASMYITTSLAEACSLRFKDVLKFHPQKKKFIGAIGKYSVGSLEELKNLHIHDFGIFLELEPDEEEKGLLEANIQAALAKESIHLEDAIDVRQIRNLKLANQLLKYRRIKKQEQDQAIADRNTQTQAEAQAMSAEKIEMAKAQAETIKTEAKSKLVQLENQLSIKKLEIEKSTKSELMEQEFQYNLRLKNLEIQAQKDIIGLQLTAQDVMGDKKNRNDVDKQKLSTGDKKVEGPVRDSAPNKTFESAGNDVLGGINPTQQFGPK